MVPMPSFFDI
jgi:hypothetical protein